MKTVLTLYLFFVFTAVKAQYLTTGGGAANAGASSVACLSGAFQNAQNVNSSSGADYAQLNILAGLGCSYYLHSSLNGMGAGGTNAGFRIATRNLANLLPAIILETYLGGQFQESASGSSLVSLLDGDDATIYFRTQKAYDALRIRLASLASVAYSLKVYWGFGSHPAGSVLPLTIKRFDVTGSRNEAVLNWQLSEEQPAYQVVVEKSTDGLNFKPIASLVVAPGGKQQYADEPAGTAWYRLRVTDLMQQIVYSPVVRFLPHLGGRQQLAVYPNPVPDGQLHISWPGTGVQELRYTLTDATGRIAGTGILVPGQPIDVHTLKKGIYVLHTDSGWYAAWTRL